MKEKHGMIGTPTYNTWKNMKTRCKNWQSFDAFVADMGLRPDGAKLRRIDTNCQYSPENCKWSASGRKLTPTVLMTPTHNSWHAMMQRCYYVKGRMYSRYGAKGIVVCDRWHIFNNFLSDMGERPHGMSIDRFPDKNGNYEPSNCRWATAKQQRRNQRSRLIPLTLNGQTMLLDDWAKKIGIHQSALYARIFYLDWSLEDALTLPPRHNNRYRTLAP